LGHAKKEDIVYRDGAKDNDLLVLSGDIGAAYLGLQVLERENEVFKVNPQSQPDLSTYSYIVERQLKPEARKDIPELLKQLGVKPTSMIDVSDGLSSEILHICKSSKVGATIYEDKIPLDPTVISTCEEFNMDSTTIALNGGEDYELLFTVKQEVTPENEGVHLVTRGNTKVAITAQGWNSLNENKEN